ncbi:50S ribosomal protein L29 [Candidatus Peregrinibacteria bacterium]|nr:50S ribosomal protein L29 [Candidatus Peregrinibacteria bacterium]
MLTIEDLKKLSEKDLGAELLGAQKEVAQRKLRVRLGEDKQSHMITGIKKYIARINTLKNSPIKK